EAVNTKTGAYPTGSFNSASPSTSSILAPQPGALLKTYPSSSDYVLRYVEIPAVVGPPAVAQTYRVDVYKKGSTTVENADGTVTLGNGTLEGSGASSCDSF